MNKLDRSTIRSSVFALEEQFNAMLKELIGMYEIIHDIQVKVTDILAVTNHIDAK